jgi:D-alanine-D-alanine ligase-like ATP-grasp enzyme
VVGDGVSTVAQLIERENEARLPLAFTYLRYPQLSEELVGDFVHSQSVPARGEVVELSKSTMVRGGASLYEVTNTIHPSYCQMAERLVARLNPAFMVVDMMIADYRQPLAQDNYVFVEYNASPSLKLYESVRGGEPLAMTKLLVDAIIDNIRYASS